MSTRRHGWHRSALAAAAALAVFVSVYIALVRLVDRRRADGSSGDYLVRLGRYRFDNMPSIPLVNVRGKAVRRFRDQMRAELELVKTRTEAAQ